MGFQIEKVIAVFGRFEVDPDGVVSLPLNNEESTLQFFHVVERHRVQRTHTHDVFSLYEG